MTERGATLRPQGLPRTVWALGLVSLFMDLSSETIHALLPIFLTTTLGASALALGLIDGVAEATAQIAKVFSGALSDRLRKRKLLVLVGYALSALTKPLFPLAAAPWQVLAARLADRIGKGIRGAPRDALIADVTPTEIRGRAYGLRQALDTAGAFAGPLAAIGLMMLFAGDIRAVFWFAIIPAVIAVACVVFGVEDAAPAPAAASGEAAPLWQNYRALKADYWAIVAVGAVFTLARFSEAFLILRAYQLGLPAALAPAVLVAMNLVYMGAAYPAGHLADRIDRKLLLFAGLGALIAADLALAFAGELIAAFAGIALWGLHMALTQGVMAALIADRAPPALRGTSFGVFNLATGVAMLCANVLAGALWDAFGAKATFLAGAGFGALAALLLVLLNQAAGGRARRNKK
jgi:MFS family permease